MSVHILNMLLFSLRIMGNFCFLQVPRFVAGNFYHFKNEGYLLEVFKMRFSNRTLSIYHAQLIFIKHGKQIRHTKGPAHFGRTDPNFP